MTEQEKTPLAGGASDSHRDHRQHTVATSSKQSAKTIVKFCNADDKDQSSIRTVKGQTARTLLALARAGTTGCTSLEVSSWAYRMAAYIHDLRKAGLVIWTQSEPHEGGQHARYVLRTKIKILESETSGA